MKRFRSLRRLCCWLGAAAMAASQSPVMISASDEVQVQEAAVANIYPLPQSITYDGEAGMRFDGPIDVVVHGEAEDIVLNKLASILNGLNLDWSQTNTPSADHAQIILSADPDHCDACGSDDEATTKEQGYWLESDDDSFAPGRITITAADQDGLFNGVLSLGQMLSQKTEDGRIAEAAISDYPDILMRGYVEGFYGIPWSFENRLEVIEDSANYKVNTYIYAPKDDPYHKDQWRTLYPETEANQLKTLVEACKANNIEFIWCAHPGNGYNYSTDDDYNSLIAKIEQLYSLGVRRFGLSYDDLSGSDNGANQSALINRVGNYLKEKYGDTGSMVTVGQRYTDGWGADWNSYLDPFLNGLDDDVVALWTGLNTGGICGKDSFNGPKNRIGYDQDLGFWFNYPVNDMAFGELLMGELTVVDPELETLRGFFMNPMNQAQASKVALYQGADYSWNIHDFDSETSWDRALQEVGCDQYESLRRFADNTSNHNYEDISIDESKELAPMFSALDAAITSNTGVEEAASALKEKFIEMQSDADILQNIDDELLLADMTTHLDAYRELGKSGEAAMDGMLAALLCDKTAMDAAISEAASHLTTANSFTIRAMNRSGGYYDEQAKVGQKYIKPYLGTVSAKINTVFRNTLAPSAQTRIITNSDSITGSFTDGGSHVELSLSGTLAKDEYAGIALDEVMKVADFAGTLPENTRVEYSFNGAEWKTYSEESGNVDAAYVRLVNVGEEELTLANFSLDIQGLFQPISQLSATTNVANGGVWQSNNISYAVDGNFNTRYYSSNGSGAGEYIQVDLGTAVPVASASIWFAANPKGLDQGFDGFKSIKLQVSQDGSMWTDATGLISSDEYIQETVNNTVMARVNLNANGATARYLRFTAGEAYGNWVQVYEIEVTQGGETAEDSTIVYGETNTSGNLDALHDASLDSSFTLASPEEGAYAIYNLSTITSLESLRVFQNSVSNARVSVQSFSGLWTELGTLDAEEKAFDVNQNVKAVRLDFEAGTPVDIAELILRQADPILPDAILDPTDNQTLNYTLLDLAVSFAQKLNREDYSEASWQNLSDQISDAKALLYHANSQKDINDAASSLTGALLALRLQPSPERLAAIH